MCRFSEAERRMASSDQERGCSGERRMWVQRLGVLNASVRHRRDTEARTIALLPASMLPTLGNDVDIRVRFRASAASARMFARASKLGQNLGALYTDVLSHLTSDEHAYVKLLDCTIHSVLMHPLADLRG